MPTTCANADQPGLIRFPIGIDKAGSRYGRRITLSKGYKLLPETDSPRSSLFGSLKRGDRDNWRNNLVLLAYFAPIRREKPRNSMRTGILAADLGRLEGLNSAPEYWNSSKMPDTGRLPLDRAAGWPCFRHETHQSHRDCDPQIIPATASCSRQNSLNTYHFFSSGLMFFFRLFEGVLNGRLELRAWQP